MSSSHRHATTGSRVTKGYTSIDPAGTIDADLAAAIAAHELKYHAPAPPPVTPPPPPPPPVTPPPVTSQPAPTAPVISAVPKVITVGPGKTALTVTGGDATLEDYDLVGPGDAVYDGASIGLQLLGPRASLARIRIRGFGKTGLLIDRATGFLVTDLTVEDVVYAGWLTTGATDGVIDRWRVSRVATKTVLPGTNNAYGSSFSMLAGQAPSQRLVARNGIVEDAPMFHGIDSHGSIDCTYDTINVRRTPRAIFLTNAADPETTKRITLRNILVTEPVTALARGGTDANVALSLYKVEGATISGLVIDPAYPQTAEEIASAHSSGIVYLDPIVRAKARPAA